MELPSSRELELETLVRERDAQLVQYNDELTRLRQHLSSQPSPSASEPVSLPPAFASVLLPHIDGARSRGGNSASNTVTAALTQRAKLLQEENDELYELLKHGETGKLKEEVRGLKRTVDKLEGALRESHQVINTLSTELDKTYEALARQDNKWGNAKISSNPPRNSHHSNSSSSGNGHSSSKVPPTGPRAFKKPRLSETSPSSSLPHSNGPTSAHKQQSHSHTRSSSRSRGNGPRDLNSRHLPERKMHHSKAEVSEHQRDRADSPMLEREREHPPGNSDRWSREREHDRDRDGGRSSYSKRNVGGSSRSNGGSARRTERDRSTNGSSSLVQGGDKTLAERMGL